jgi:hypothetical protein
MKTLTGKDLVAFFKKQPVAIVCGLVSVALLVTLYFRWDAVATQEKIKNEKTAEKERLFANASTKDLAEQLAVLVAANKTVEEQRAVRKRETTKTLGYIYQLEAEAGVKALTTQQNASPAPVKGAPVKAYGTVGYTLSVQGDFRQTVDLLRRFERGQHFSRMVTATVNSPGPSEEGLGKVTLNLNVELLALP